MDELSFDKYNANADRTYRINSDIRFGGADLHMPVHVHSGAADKQTYGPYVGMYVTEVRWWSAPQGMRPTDIPHIAVDTGPNPLTISNEYPRTKPRARSVS